ncbi:MAG TPA: hypothetical protein VJT31_04915, partial [Rugosimonospora sp.]|nr:hypothetical protein [Rugosimonospora sp.]
ADALLDVAEARAETLAATAQTLDGLTLAEEASISPTLGGTLLGVVDKFQLAVQSLTTLTATDMLPTTVHRNLAQLRQVQAGLVTAAASLNGGILRELDRLLAQRTSGLTPERRLALAAAATAVLFAGLSLLLGSGSRRRVRPPSAPAAPGVPPPDRVPPADRVPTADRVPSWPGPGFRVPDEREWSGAAR